MHSQFISLESPSNQMSVPLLCWSPKNSDTPGVSVFLHGRNPAGHLPYDEATLRMLYPWENELHQCAEFYNTHILIPYLGNWSHADPSRHPGVRRCTFLGGELPAWARSNLDSSPDRIHWTILGFSMGGTGAVNVLARYPDTYAVACNFAGNCDPAFYHLRGKPDSITEEVFGTWQDNHEEYAKWNNETALQMLAGRADVGLASGCGREDMRLAAHGELCASAAAKGLLFSAVTYAGGHDYDASHMALQLSMTQFLRNQIMSRPKL